MVNISNLLTASLLAAAAIGSNVHRTQSVTSQCGDAVDELSAKGLANLEKWTKTHPPTCPCTLENAVVRREWYEPCLAAVLDEAS